MQHQLAELRLQIDFDDPVLAEAEATFAAMIARIVREADVADSIAKLRDDRNRLRQQLTRASPEDAGVMAEQQIDLMAERMMLGTAEAYDASEQHAERWETSRTLQQQT
jgi:hypothetical protein